MTGEDRTSHGWLHFKRNGKLSSLGKEKGGYHFRSETKPIEQEYVRVGICV